MIAYLASPSQVVLSGPASPIDGKTGKVSGALEGESMKIVEQTLAALRRARIWAVSERIGGVAIISYGGPAQSLATNSAWKFRWKKMAFTTSKSC